MRSRSCRPDCGQPTICDGSSIAQAVVTNPLYRGSIADSGDGLLREKHIMQSLIPPIDNRYRHYVEVIGWSWAQGQLFDRRQYGIFPRPSCRTDHEKFPPSSRDEHLCDSVYRLQPQLVGTTAEFQGIRYCRRITPDTTSRFASGQQGVHMDGNLGWNRAL